MKKCLLFAWAIAMTGMYGCKRDDTPEQKPRDPISLSASLNLPAQLEAVWVNGSAIGVYCMQAVSNTAVGAVNYQAAITEGSGTANAQFGCTLVQGEGKHQFYAYTPYSVGAGDDVAKVVGILRADQTQSGATAADVLKNSFLYARSSFSAGNGKPQHAAFDFQNLFGVVEFLVTTDGSLPGASSLTEVSFDAGEGTVLAGNFTADLTAAAVVPVFTGGQARKVILAVSNGDLSDGKTVRAWMVVAPGDYTGKTFAIEAKVGGNILKFERAGVKIEANTISQFPLMVEDQSVVKLNNDGAYSNCYIVTQPNTKYKFDAKVQGNGKTTTGITPEQIDPKQVFVVWETGSQLGGVISSVKLADDGFVTFTTSGKVDGNAMIAVTDGRVTEALPKGKILWSWHIWAADYTAANDKRCVNFASKEYTIMDRNLGDWTQPEGTTTTFLGLKYQWGRKDAFVGFGTGNKVVPNACVVTDEKYYGIQAAFMGESDPVPVTAKETIKVTVENPSVFIKSGSGTSFDWYGIGTGVDNRNNNLWGNSDGQTPVKTIYDPCPKGYMVAPLDAFSGFFKTGLSVNFIDRSKLNISGSWNNGWNFITQGADHTYFPAAGSLNFGTGVIRIVPGPSGATGYYWTSTPPAPGNNLHQMRAMLVERDDVMLNTANRATGESVRCVRE